MSDDSVWLACYREIKRQKKRSNLAFSTRQLTEAGLTFTSNNYGVHLVLMKGDQPIDFWPSTGLWWVRTNRNKRRGIDNLIKFMKAKT